MKLISCYIEGYGKIKQWGCPFDGELTSFLWENGEGKTTFASFLKAMLYGLEGYRKGATEFCDREHFYPFDGGRFGGNLCLEADGKEYKIERFFAEKSKTGDSLTVYEDGKLMENPPVEMGKLLLGVDKESFERTLFLRHDDLEIASTADVQARLNQILGGVAEDGGLDEGVKSLEKAAKEYKKSKAGNDLISVEKGNIDKLNEKIQNASTVKASLEGKYAREEELQARLRSMREELVRAQKEGEKASQREHYDALLERACQAERALEDLRGKYPFGVPDLEETKAFNAYMGASNLLQIKMDGARLSADEQEELLALTARFERIPANEELVDIERRIDRLKGLQIATESARSVSAKEKALEEKFSRQKPTSEEMEKAEENLTAYRGKLRALENTHAFVQGKGKATSAKRYAFAAICALLLLLVGVAAILLKQRTIGGALAALGSAGLLAVGFFYLNKKSSAQGMVENTERSILEREARELERALQALLLPLGYGGEQGVEVGFAALKRDFCDYEEGLSARRQELETLAQKRAEKAALEEELSAFFAPFGEKDGEYFARLSSLKEGLATLRALTARRAESEKIIANAREEAQSLLEKMAAYQAKYHLQTVNAEELLEDARRSKELLQAAQEGKEKAAAFKNEKGLEDRWEAPQNSVEELQEEYARLQDELAKIGREIDEDERFAERLEGYEEEKKAAKERLKEYERKYKLLSATMEFLKDAAGRLRDKYVKPIKEEFLRHAEVIEKALGEKVVMTKDFELRFERNGVERSEKHLSSGQRSVCALCFRLALIRNMYDGRLPFLVLDDPFLTLDETHIARVKEVLKALSKDMQMIYFTCHSSREI